MERKEFIILKTEELFTMLTATGTTKHHHQTNEIVNIRKSFCTVHDNLWIEWFNNNEKSTFVSRIFRICRPIEDTENHIAGYVFLKGF